MNITIIITKSGSSDLITVKVGMFGGFVNVSLRVSGTKLGRMKHNKKTKDKTFRQKIDFFALESPHFL